MFDRLIKLDSTYNFRDMGAYLNKDNRMVKTHLLFRADSLSKLTEADVSKLQMLNITTIVDYRSDQERLNNEDVEIPGTKVIVLDPIANIAMFAGSGKGDFDLSLFTQENAAQFLTEQNIEFVESDRGREVYKNLILEALHSEGGFVNHCSAGKDRTGYGSALILLLLGVSEEDVLEDYMLTNENLKNKPKDVSSLDAPSPELERAMKYFEGVEVSYIKPALDLINTKYNGIEQYVINQLGISKEEIELFRDKYLEEEVYEG